MERLPKDLMIKIALDLDLPEILRFCQTSREINRKVCQNNEFWKHKISRDFNIELKFVGPIKHAREYYKFFNRIKDYTKLTALHILAGRDMNNNMIRGREGIFYTTYDPSNFKSLDDFFNYLSVLKFKKITQVLYENDWLREFRGPPGLDEVLNLYEPRAEFPIIRIFDLGAFDTFLDGPARLFAEMKVLYYDD